MNVDKLIINSFAIINFYANLVNIMKLHLNNERNEDFNKVILLQFYDKIEKMFIEINDEEEKKLIKDKDYDNILMFVFRIKKDKKKRKFIKIIKSRKFFNKISKFVNAFLDKTVE